MIKKILSIVLSALLVFSAETPLLTVSAAEVPQESGVSVETKDMPQSSSAAAAPEPSGDFTCGDYHYSVSNNKATITNYFGTESNLTIPSNLDGYTVTGIGYEAFSNCKTLTSADIPNSVTEIGAEAFAGCTSLTTITIPNSVNILGCMAFDGCTSLKAVTIPDAVTYIDYYTFSRCTSLTSVVIPVSVTSIYAGAFEDSSAAVLKCIDNTYAENYAKQNNIAYVSLKSSDLWQTSDLGNNNISISKYIGNLSDVDIPSKINGKTVTKIGDYAFKDCTFLKSVTIPSSVTTISSWAFANCSALSNITIPNTVTSIGGGAFYQTPWLANYPNDFVILGDGILLKYKGSGENPVIPHNVKYIGDYVFDNNTSLVSVTIPNSVISIGSKSFRNCTSLTSVTIPDSILSISVDAFTGCTSLTLKFIDNTFIENFAKENNISYVSLKLSDLWETEVLENNNIAITKYIGDLIDIDIPRKIDGKTVTGIGNFAFKDCTSLASVTIPNSVTSIGHSTFNGCSSITSLTIPNSVTSIGNYAFYNCTALTSVNIPNSVTSIGEYDFSHCKSLTRVNIPNSVISIGTGAFFDCKSLTSINIPNSVTSIGDYNFDECIALTSVNIPNSVTGIGNYAFRSCTSLASVNIPNSVTSIGNSAFNDCTSLTSVTIPNSVTSIGNYAFYNCKSLINVTIPVSVTNIKYSAFHNTPWLNNYPNDFVIVGKNILIKYKGSDENVVVPNTVETISGAFSKCETLKSVIIPSSVTSICNYAFAGCTSLTSVTIPNSVTVIGEVAFADCVSLTNISIPNSVTVIGEGAFADCVSLTNIAIPNSVTNIGCFAFLDCTSLTNLTIPNSVTGIDDFAFQYCISLSSITILNSVTVFGKDVFELCESLKKIKCLKDSTAESYAKGYVIPVEYISGLENLSTVDKTIVSKGQTVRITGNAKNGSAPYQYKFSYKRSNQSSYTVKSDYGKANSVMLTPAYVDTYIVKVDVKDSTGCVESAIFTITSVQPLENISTVDKSAVSKGQTVRITGNAKNGTAPYQYKFSYKRSNQSSYTVKSDYGKADSVILTPAYVGTYIVKVDVKDSTGYVTTLNLYITSTSPLENRSTVNKTSVAKGKTVKITGNAAYGTAPYQYRFSYKRAAQSSYTVKSDYGKASSATLTPVYTGTYYVKVDVKDSTGKVATKTFTIKSVN